MAGISRDGEAAAENEAQALGIGAGNDFMINAPLIVCDQIVRPGPALRMPHIPPSDAARVVPLYVPAPSGSQRRSAMVKQQLPLRPLDLARRMVRIRGGLAERPL